MAKTKSALKAARVAQRRRLRNRMIRSAVKTHITKAERLILDNELDSAAQVVTEALTALDKAAQKGVIHVNNAARRKSRLMKKLNRAQSLSSASQ